MSAAPLSIDELRGLIRNVPDFPLPGIQFRDISPLIGHGEGLRSTIVHLAEAARAMGAQKIAGMEARGFIFGTGVAVELGIGFLPVRKPGKLPVKTLGIDYDLEYGADRLELDPTAVSAGERIVIVDDLIATGGTACATAELLRLAGAEVSDALFVIDLPELGGAQRLQSSGVTVQNLIAFDGL